MIDTRRKITQIAAEAVRDSIQSSSLESNGKQLKNTVNDYETTDETKLLQTIQVIHREHHTPRKNSHRDIDDPTHRY